jgi:hypothetical protein
MAGRLISPMAASSASRGMARRAGATKVGAEYGVLVLGGVVHGQRQVDADGRLADQDGRSSSAHRPSPTERSAQPHRLELLEKVERLTDLGRLGTEDAFRYNVDNGVVERNNVAALVPLDRLHLMGEFG